MTEIKRPIIIANCSGANMDLGVQMYRQVTLGPVDAVYGDYLAEMNLADNSRAYRDGKHPGWEPTCEDGIMQSLEVVSEKRIKVVVNGGALNPKGLAEKVAGVVASKKLDLKVAYVFGDDLYPEAKQIIDLELFHLDSSNKAVAHDPIVTQFLQSKDKVQVVSLNAYLGTRAIIKGLEQGADIIICGRVADASPVIGLASWWHGWSSTDYDQLAGSLVAGHLTECSGYTTGANFCDFYRYRPVEKLVNIGYPIAEVAHDGTFVVTKHEGLNGFVNEDTCRAQFLYELQGNDYLNSDVKALLDQVKVDNVGRNRVKVSGIVGAPPPPTTKLALFYNSGYQSEFTINATGTSQEVDAKFDLQKRQLLYYLQHDVKVHDQFDLLEFQQFAHPDENAATQELGTSSLRIIGQATTAGPLVALIKGLSMYGMQHFSGLHFSRDFRTIVPKEINSFYPAIIEQSRLKEGVTFVGGATYEAEKVAHFEPIGVRVSYDTAQPSDAAGFGETVTAPLSEFVLARSGDKGSNVNIGLFVHEADEYEWLKTVMSRAKLQQLIGDDWRDSYFIERVEMPHIKAVHFVVYGILGRGVSSSARVDCLGKGFGDWIRSRYVELPKKFVNRYKNVTYTIE